MRGIVLKADRRKIVVLTEDGSFIERTLDGRRYTLGQEIVVPPQRKGYSRQFAALAASLLIFLTSGIGYGAFFYPQGYINIDVNPSIEISYNLFHRVIASQGINLEGAAIVEAVGQLKHQRIDEVVKAYLDEIEEQGYIETSSDRLALITINGKDPEDMILASIIDDFNQEAMAFDLAVADGQKTNRVRQQENSDQSDLTPGEYNLMEKIERYRWEMSQEESGQTSGGVEGRSTQELIDEVKQIGKSSEIHEIKGQNKNQGDPGCIEELETESGEQGKEQESDNGKKEGGK